MRWVLSLIGIINTCEYVVSMDIHTHVTTGISGAIDIRDYVFSQRAEEGL